MKIGFKGFTDQGLFRGENQDCFWGAEHSFGYSFLVCDGMGGLEKGREAAAIAVKRIRENVASTPDGWKAVSVEECARRVNSEIIANSKNSGTTMSYLSIDNITGEFEIVHIGDSRIYAIYEDGERKLLTEDHSVIAEMQRKNYQLSEEFIKANRSKLTRCLGIDGNVECFRAKGSMDGIKGFILASDGYWHWLEEIGVLEDFEEFVRRARSFGEKDNITAIVVNVE